MISVDLFAHDTCILFGGCVMTNVSPPLDAITVLVELIHVVGHWGQDPSSGVLAKMSRGIKHREFNSGWQCKSSSNHL